MISATVEVYVLPKTIGDVREWLANCEKIGLTDAHPVEDGLLFAVSHTEEIHYIECWDHVPDPSQPEYGLPKDLLIALHSHDQHGDEAKPE